MDPWPLFQHTGCIQSLSMFIHTFSFLALKVPEKSVTKIFKKSKFENLSSDTRVMGPWPPFYHCTFLNLETMCGIRFTEVGPQT